MAKIIYKEGEYLKELKEWVDYLDEYNNNVYPLQEERIDLANKRIEASNTGDSKKVLSYCELEADKYEEIIKSLHAMYVPKIAKNFHDYWTKYYIKHKQWLAYLIKSGREVEAGIYGYNDTKAQNLLDEADHLMAQSKQESKRIERYLNQKAKDLNLTIPFPDQD